MQSREEKSAYNRIWKQEHREEIREQQRSDQYREYKRKHNKKLRETVIVGYGATCSKCGESRPEVLDLDHINGGGSRERRSGITSYVLYSRVIKNGFPSDYQLLCRNCNWMKHVTKEATQ